MMNSSFSSGIFAGDNESISFGKHFRDRSPRMSDIVVDRGTPPEIIFPSDQKG